MTNFKQRLQSGKDSGNITAGLLSLVEHKTDFTDAIAYVKEWESLLLEEGAIKPKDIIINTVEYYLKPEKHEYSKNLFYKIKDIVNSPDELNAIKLLKMLGYRIYKPKTTYEEI